MENYQNSSLLDALNLTSSIDEKEVFTDSLKSLASQIDRHNCGYECTMHGNSKTYSSGHQRIDFKFDSLKDLQNFGSISSLTDILIPQNNFKSFKIKAEVEINMKESFSPMYEREETKTIGSKEFVKNEESNWYSSVLNFYELKNKEINSDFKKEEEMEKNKNDKRSGSEKRSEDIGLRESDENRQEQDPGRDRGNNEPGQSFLSFTLSSSTGIFQSIKSKSKSDDSGSSEGNEGGAGETVSISDSSGSKLQDSSGLHSKNSC